MPQRGYSRVGAENSATLYNGLVKNSSSADVSDARVSVIIKPLSRALKLNTWIAIL